MDVLVVRSLKSGFERIAKLPIFDYLRIDEICSLSVDLSLLDEQSLLLLHLFEHLFFGD